MCGLLLSNLLLYCHIFIVVIVVLIIVIQYILLPRIQIITLCKRNQMNLDQLASSRFECECSRLNLKVTRKSTKKAITNPQSDNQIKLRTCHLLLFMINKIAS